MTYRYEAATRDGRIERGIQEGRSRTSVARDLAIRGLYVLELAQHAPKERERASIAVRGRALRDDALAGLRYVASLVDVGTPLDAALEAASATSRTPEVTETFDRIRASVRRGESFAETLSEHPRLFPKGPSALIAAGERSGHLARGIADAVALAERERNLRVQILTNLAYPVVVLAVATGVVVLLVTVVLPRFADLFQEAGSELPASTRVLLGGSRMLAEGWPLCLLLGGALLTAAAIWTRGPDGRRRMERLLYALPVVGSIYRQHTAVRIGSALGPALRSGIPLSEAGGVVADSLSPGFIGERLRESVLEVRQGRSFTQALRTADLLPERFLRMVEMGEGSGQLAEVLERAVEAAQEELSRRLDVLVRLLEPALIILLGGILGFVALALLQALYRVQSIPL